MAFAGDGSCSAHPRLPRAVLCCAALVGMLVLCAVCLAHSPPTMLLCCTPQPTGTGPAADGSSTGSSVDAQELQPAQVPSAAQLPHQQPRPGQSGAGLNSSQLNAVTTALGRTLTLWQGPPGTGKTRTLLRCVCGF